jgi:hypothetical protein
LRNQEGGQRDYDDPSDARVKECANFFYDKAIENEYTKVKILEESDRSVQGARLVFDSLFHGLEVRINNIYELKRAYERYSK